MAFVDFRCSFAEVAANFSVAICLRLDVFRRSRGSRKIDFRRSHGQIRPKWWGNLFGNVWEITKDPFCSALDSGDSSEQW
jgi:hypothetical protein